MAIFSLLFNEYSGANVFQEGYGTIPHHFESQKSSALISVAIYSLAFVEDSGIIEFKQGQGPLFRTISNPKMKYLNISDYM